jgi:hypothetical protein
MHFLLSFAHGMKNSPVPELMMSCLIPRICLVGSLCAVALHHLRRDRGWGGEGILQAVPSQQPQQSTKKANQSLTALAS